MISILPVRAMSAALIIVRVTLGREIRSARANLARSKKPEKRCHWLGYVEALNVIDSELTRIEKTLEQPRTISEE